VKRGVLLVVLAVLTLQAVAVGLANPSLPTYPETPDKNPPLITLELNSKLDFVITVEKPASWYFNNTVLGSLRSVGYVLDGSTNVTIADSETGNHPGFLPGTQNAAFTGTLSGLADGRHSIQVWANSVTFYHPEGVPQDFYGWWSVSADYPIEAQSAVLNFSVTDSRFAADDQLPPNSNNSPYSWLPVAAISVVVAVVVAVSAVVYLKKRRR
jgi:hypothetical protein